MKTKRIKKAADRYIISVYGTLTEVDRENAIRDFVAGARWVIQERESAGSDG